MKFKVNLWILDYRIKNLRMNNKRCKEVKKIKNFKEIFILMKELKIIYLQNFKIEKNQLKIVILKFIIQVLFLIIENLYDDLV